MKKILLLILMIILVFNTFSFAQDNEKIIDVKLLSKHTSVQEYCVGDTINLAGVRAEIWYRDYSVDVIDFSDNRIKATGFDSTKPGKCLVNVCFDDDSIKVPLYRYVVEIKEKDPNEKSRGASLKKGNNDYDFVYLIEQPTKTVYSFGEEIDLSGALFYIREANDIFWWMNEDDSYVRYNDTDFTYTLFGFHNTIPGYQRVDVDCTYKGFDFSFYIDVVVKENSGDRVVVKMATIDYPNVIENDELDWTNALFQIEYDDGSTEFITYNSNHMDYNLLQRTDLYYYFEALYFEPNFLYDYNTAVTTHDVDIPPINDEQIEESSVNYNFNNDRDIVKQSVYDIGELPEKYSLRDCLNIKTEDQGRWGLCWDFAMTKSLETNYNMKYGKKYDLSEKYVDYMTLGEFTGTDRVEGDGGHASIYINEMEKTGVPTEETVPYVQMAPSEYRQLDSVEKVVQPVSAFSASMSNIEIEENKETLNKMIKSHILDYGSAYVAVTFYDYTDGVEGFNQSYFYRTVTYPYSSGHAISIIGWDDTISKNAFKCRTRDKWYVPEHDGAWLALNSHGEDFGFDKGLFYISYDTVGLDFGGIIDSKPYINSNTYTHLKNESLMDDYTPLFSDGSDKCYFYIEYEKENSAEYLTNIIFPYEYPTAKYYLLSNYESLETADYTKLELLGAHKNGQYYCVNDRGYDNYIPYYRLNTFSFLNGNIVFDEPIRLSNNKFMIVMEIEKKYCDIDLMPIKRKESDTHTYYSSNVLSNNPTLLSGDIPFCAFTIGRNDYISQNNSKVDRVEIVSLPSKTVYNFGQDIDLTGGNIKIYYANEFEEVKSMTDEDVYWYGYTDWDEITGNKKIYVFYGDKFATFNIEIRNEIDRIEMNELPRTLYNHEKLKHVEIKNGSIIIYYLDGTTKIKSLDSDNISINPTSIDYDSPGVLDVEVEYRGFPTSYQVEVSNKCYCDFESPSDIVYVSLGDLIDLSIFEGILSYNESGERKEENVFLNNDDYEIINIVNKDTDEVIYSKNYLDVLPERYLEEGTFEIEVVIKGVMEEGPKYRVRVVDNKRNRVRIPQIEPYEYVGNVINLNLPGVGEIYEIIEGDSSAADAGTYTMTLALIDKLNNVWVDDNNDSISSEPQTITWTIEKVTPQISISNKIQPLSNVKAPNIKITPEITNGTVTLSYAEKNSDTFSAELPTEEGFYKVKVTVKGDKNLYNKYIVDDFEIRDYMKGDIDNNEEVTIIDVRLLLQAYINSSGNYSEEELLMMDMNDDETIDIKDVRLLLQEYINA